MKTSITIAALLATGFLAGSASAALTFTLEASFDNVWNGDPGVVGNGFFSYEAPAALADGSYLLSSFTAPSFTVIFNNASTFTLGDLVNTSSNPYIGIDISLGQFNFTTTSPNDYSGGSADFVNVGNDHLSLSPNVPGQAFGVPYAQYYLSVQNIEVYGGGYGIESAPTTINPPSPIPEPANLLALSGLVGAAMFLRTRRSKSVA